MWPDQGATASPEGGRAGWGPMIAGRQEMMASGPTKIQWPVERVDEQTGDP